MTAVHRKRIVGFLLVIIASLIFGTVPALTQRILETGTAIETILASRFFIGTTVLWSYILIRRQRFRIGRRTGGFLLLISLVQFFCTTAMNESYRYLPGAVASILVFLYVVIVVIIEILMGREKAEPVRIFCMVLAVAGMVAVIRTPEDSLQFSLYGISMAMAAAVFYAIYAVAMGSRRLARVQAEVVTAYVMLVPTVANTIRCIGADQPLLPYSGLPAILIAVLGVCAVFVAPVCFTQAVKIIGASDAALVNTSEPLIAYLAGILIMSDRISWNATLGGLMIVVAIFLLNVAEKRRGHPIEPPPTR